MDKEEVDLITSELERVFKESFRLKDDDVKHYIEKILNEKDDKVIWELTTFFLNFEKYDANGRYSLERAKASRLVLDRCIKLYMVNKEKIKTNFFTAMDYAKKQGIDPFKIATMENLRKLNLTIYQNTYSTLTQIEYKNPITGQNTKLFDDISFKELIENCASLICNVSENNVRDIVSILTCFSYDKASGEFLANTADMIKLCGTLLTYPGHKLRSNIAYLKTNFIPPMTEPEFIVRLSKSPSIMMCDQAKINDFEKHIYQNLIELKNENSALFPQGEEFEKFAKEYAHDAAFNIDKISSITGLTKENLEQFTSTKNVLVKYLGAKNAFETFTDFNVLSIKPEVLDGLLAKLTEYDNQNQTFLRKFFIEHTARALNMLQEDQLSTSPSKRTGRTVTPRKVRADLQSMPTEVSGGSYLSNSDQKMVNSLFENVKQTFEARKVRKVVNGVEELSEEEQEEQEYMREIFDRIQESFDASKCQSRFDELISRVEAMIDAKEGKGFANKTYGISTMRYIDRKYREACDDAKQLCQVIFPLLCKMNSLVSKRIPMDKKDYREFINDVNELGDILIKCGSVSSKIDRTFSFIKREILTETLKCFKKFNVPDDKNPENKSDWYYEQKWFDESHNSTSFLIGTTVSYTQGGYAQFLRDQLEKFVPDAFDNIHYGLAVQDFAEQEIELKYLIYASRMYMAIAFHAANMLKDINYVLDNSGMISQKNSSTTNIMAPNVLKFDNLNNSLSRPSLMTGNLRNYGLSSMTVVEQIISSAYIRKDIRDAIFKFNKSLNGFRPMKNIADYMDEVEHTDAGLLFSMNSSSGKVVVFMDQPEVEKDAKIIEQLGVKKCNPEKYKDAYFANYAVATEIFTPLNRKHMHPVELKEEK